MRIPILILSTLASPAFAKFEPPPPPSESITLKFARTCAHALDAEEGQELLYRQMQRWLEVYLRDPDPTLPADHRFANVLTELYELAMDRTADLPRAQQDLYVGYLEQSKLGDGAVPDVSDALIFLATLTEINHELRRAGKPDLGAAAFAGAPLGIMNGTLYHSDVRVGFEDPDDLDTRHLIIEPPAHDAFTVVEGTLAELRRGRGLEILRSTMRPQYAFRLEAAFETIRNLQYARGELPARIVDLVDRLIELRKTFDGDSLTEKPLEFKRMGSILGEIFGYVKLADQMNRLGWAAWTLDHADLPAGAVAR